jgi:hypothetical protein
MAEVATKPSTTNGAGHGGDLAAAEAAEHLQRIGQVAAMERESLGDRVALAGEPVVIDAGAGADPVGRIAAEQGGEDGGGDGGVADAHLADGEKVDAAGGRFHAEGHGGGAIALAHRGVLGEVGGRLLERQVVDLEAEVVGEAKLVDGGAAAAEVLDHLRGDRRRIGRDALRRDAMVAGEDRDQRAVDRGRAPALPGGEPFGDLLEAAEGARRLGEHRVAGANLRHRIGIRAGHGAEERADVVEGQRRQRLVQGTKLRMRGRLARRGGGSITRAMDRNQRGERFDGR